MVPSLHLGLLKRTGPPWQAQVWALITNVHTKACSEGTMEEHVQSTWPPNHAAHKEQQQAMNWQSAVLQKGPSEGQESTTRLSLWFLYLFLCLVQSSRSVVSDSSRPHRLQHARPPCPSPTPRVYSNSGPSRRWSSVNSIFYTWIELIRPKF